MSLQNHPKEAQGVRHYCMRQLLRSLHFRVTLLPLMANSPHTGFIFQFSLFLMTYAKEFNILLPKAKKSFQASTPTPCWAGR